MNNIIGLLQKTDTIKLIVLSVIIPPTIASIGYTYREIRNIEIKQNYETMQLYHQNIKFNKYIEDPVKYKNLYKTSIDDDDISQIKKLIEGSCESFFTAIDKFNKQQGKNK